MNKEQFNELERDYSNAESNRKWGMYIFIGAILAVIANISWGWTDSPVFVGIIIGGSLVFFAINYEKSKALKRKLDQICTSRYGKMYKDSLVEIIHDKWI
ncbi:MAG: hypothetical protein KA732_21030 [Providencia sp.]|uniref:hypothetical protein n=1 Tax=Providencia sp. TaxID=589 RepID=UPI001B51F92D|nr:hypothetical protein [Providencia sp.]MBP6083729.1 hypothetical protein [Providencia sp.]